MLLRSKAHLRLDNGASGRVANRHVEADHHLDLAIFSLPSSTVSCRCDVPRRDTRGVDPKVGQLLTAANHALSMRFLSPPCH